MQEETNQIDLVAQGCEEVLKVLNGKTHSLAVAILEECTKNVSAISIVTYS